MTFPSTLTDKDNQSYIECEGAPAKRVKVCSTPSDPVNVVNGALATPRIVNFNYNTANQIESIALSINTFKILLKHRDKGILEFSYDSGLTTFVKLPKGSSYSDEGFILTGQTLYFRSPIVGTVELLEYSFT